MGIYQDHADCSIGARGNSEAREPILQVAKRAAMGSALAAAVEGARLWRRGASQGSVIWPAALAMNQ